MGRRGAKIIRGPDYKKNCKRCLQATTDGLNSDFHLPEKFVLFASMKAF